jgi:hypothetical protein
LRYAFAGANKHSPVHLTMNRIGHTIIRLTLPYTPSAWCVSSYGAQLMKFPSTEGWPKAGVVDFTRLLFSSLIRLQLIIVPTPPLDR